MGSPSKSENKMMNNNSSRFLSRICRNNCCVQWMAVIGFAGILLLMLLNQQLNSSTGSSIGRSTQLSDVQIRESMSSSSTMTTYMKPPARDTSKQYKPIKQISVLGERNSGTRWTVEHIEECFNHSIKVVRRLTRHKHWFQYEDPNLYYDQTLVLAQFRNPYEWLKAMQHVPHHAPAHLRTKPDVPIEVLRAQSTAGNDWKIFLTKPWTTERVGLDLQMKGDEMCQGQERFPFKDIVSCAKEPLPESSYNYTIRFSENEPFYEMRNDGSGLPYDNIMEMRSEKIQNHLNVRNFKGIADVWVLQYEYLLAEGTQHLLDRIQEWTGITPQCTAKDPQYRPPRKSRIVTPEYASFVREHLNWTAEALIGYGPELQREQQL